MVERQSARRGRVVLGGGALQDTSGAVAPSSTNRSSAPGSIWNMDSKITNPLAADEIVAALATPGRQARLRRWSAEFLDRLGDVPDLEEGAPTHRPGRTRHHAGLPVQRCNRDSGLRAQQAARHGR